MTEYRDELAYLMRERLGPKKDRPVRYTAAFSLTSSIADLLAEREFAAFLDAALRGDRDSRKREGPVTWTFREYFADALREAVGESGQADGLREAWHIAYTVHCILPGDEFGAFIQCASDAWSETVDLAQRMTAGV
ncbi:hypothetical protein [Streptomyces sp. NPDC059122]|uniref:hypothetical protein n=1 Tax=Streptomyces sp. NPDC059122 TaxID=3346732 RepID=UPI00367712D4